MPHIEINGANIYYNVYGDDQSGSRADRADSRLDDRQPHRLGFHRARACPPV